MQDVYQYIEEHRQEFLTRLLPFLAQPSISTQDIGMRESADLLRRVMEEVGISTRIIETARHPVVFGEVDEGAENTLLVYGHYDVQPPEPLEAWTTPPFEPTIRDGYIYCRGVADNKGQLFGHVMAVAALKATRGKLGCNMKFLFEGEEEISSQNLGSFIESHRELLKADAAFCADALQHASGQPFVFPGLKGIITFELVARGANRDCHSAMADIIPNPAWRLMHALTSMRTLDGRVLVEGFYDRIIPLSEEDKELLNAAPNPKEHVKAVHDLPELLPAAEESYHIARTEPTFNVAGFVSGYTGKGFKTVLPSEARAKLDVRLVPDQDPEEIAAAIRSHLDKHGFADIEMVRNGTAIPSLTDVRHPYVQMVTHVAREAFGREPLLYPRVVGSGPDHYFTKTLGLPSVIVPYAGDASETHAPNENMSVQAFIEGIRNSATLFAAMGSYQAPGR